MSEVQALPVAEVDYKWPDDELVVRLSDFETLAAECERLRAANDRLHAMVNRVVAEGILIADDRDAALAELAALKGGWEAVAEWRPVAGYEGIYSVSSNGELRNDVTGLLLSSSSLVGSGYTKASLHKNGQRKQTTIHRIVAEAFLEKTGEEVNHKNGIKTDNRVSNLEWCSRSHNVNHSYCELGNCVSPIEAVSASSGAVEKFRSVEEAVRDGGFDSAHIYRCLNNPHKTHKGFHFRKSSTPPAQASAWVPEGLTAINRSMGRAIVRFKTTDQLNAFYRSMKAALPAAPTPGASDGNGGKP